MDHHRWNRPCDLPFDQELGLELDQTITKGIDMQRRKKSRLTDRLYLRVLEQASEGRLFLEGTDGSLSFPDEFSRAVVFLEKEECLKQEQSNEIDPATGKELRKGYPIFSPLVVEDESER